MTRTFSCGSFSACATAGLTVNGACVPTQSVALPFSVCATAEWVSSGACDT